VKHFARWAILVCALLLHVRDPDHDCLESAPAQFLHAFVDIHSLGQIPKHFPTLLGRGFMKLDRDFGQFPLVDRHAPDRPDDFL
jgi:hypothetical protein